MNTHRLTVRVTNPAELLSVVPYTLGFQPRQSLVILSFRNTGLLSVARIDLPETIEAAHHADYRASLGNLASVVHRHGASTVVLAGYGSAELVGVAVQIATDAFAAGGIPVREALRVGDGRYYSFTCPDPDCCPADGTPFDPTSTVVAATATFAGIVAVSDRDELLTQLTPIGGAARQAFAEATAAACTRLVDRLDTAAGSGGDDDDLSPRTPFGRQLLHEGEQAVADARCCYRSGQILDDERAAILTVLLNMPSVRDATARDLTGEAWELQMWADLVRRAEPDFVASSANLLAICALGAGNGLLASLAVARAIDAEPDNQLARLLRHAIDAGMSPGEVAALLVS